MNIPFPPVFLWLLLPLIVWASRRWHRRATDNVRQRLQGQPAETDAAAPDGVPPTARARISRYRLVLGVLAALYLAFHLAFFSAPPMRGRVTDADSGAPIAGATVSRSFYATMGFQLVESPREIHLDFSMQKTATRSDGTFFLPGFLNLWPVWFNGLSGFGWVVTHPDYVPIFDCQKQGFNPIGAWDQGCGSFRHALKPWASAIWKTGIMSANLQLAVQSTTTRAAAGEVFPRMRTLLYYRAVEAEEVVAAARSFVARFPLDDFVADELYQSQAMLGHYENGQSYKIHEAVSLFRIVDAYCLANPAASFCIQREVALRNTRKWLENQDSGK